MFVKKNPVVQFDKASKLHWKSTNGIYGSWKGEKNNIQSVHVTQNVDSIKMNSPTDEYQLASKV